jgi:hypothetical protein
MRYLILISLLFIGTSVSAQTMFGQKQFPRPDDATAVNATQTKSATFILCSDRTFGSMLVSDVNGTGVLKLNSNLDSIGYYNLGILGYPRQIIQHPNDASELVVLVAKEDHGLTRDVKTQVITAFDTNGILRWQSDYTLPRKYPLPQAMTANAIGDFVVAGMIVPDTVGQLPILYASRVATGGIYIWQQEYLPQFRAPSVIGVHEIKPDTFMIPAIYGASVFYILIDGNGNQIGRGVLYDEPTSKGFNTAKLSVAPDGSYLLWGRRYVGSGSQHGFLAKLDRFFNVEWLDTLSYLDSAPPVLAGDSSFTMLYYNITNMGNDSITIERLSLDRTKVFFRQRTPFNTLGPRVAPAVCFLDSSTQAATCAGTGRDRSVTSLNRPGVIRISNVGRPYTPPVINSTDKPVTGVPDRWYPRLSPNPAVGHTVIHDMPYGTVGQYQLCSSAGQVVRSGTYYIGEHLDLRQVSPGLYYVKFATQHGTFVMRLVVGG